MSLCKEDFKAANAKNTLKIRQNTSFIDIKRHKHDPEPYMQNPDVNAIYESWKENNAGG